MRKGFTLVELVIVIVILGILAAVAIPKFVDIVTDAKLSATKGGLGAARGVIALGYSKNLAGATTPYYPATITTGDFFDGRLPVNKVNNLDAITTVAAPPAGTATSATYGWWFITTGTQAGQAGAYSDGTQDTSTW